MFGHALILALLGLVAPLAVTARESSQVERSQAGYRSVVRLDNERVRVVENSYEPGASSAEHSHEWPRVVYVIEGGTLELIDATGERTRLELEPGTTAWRSPETHTVHNPGPTRVRVLEIEVRQLDRGGSGTPPG